MTRRLLTAVLLGSMALAAPSGQVPERQLTLQEVITRNLEARGGGNLLGSIQSIRVRGKIINTGKMLPFMRVWKRPNKLHMSFSVDGMVVTQAFDGQTAWMVTPLLAQGRARELRGEDACTLQEEADFQGPLVDYQARGDQVELMGLEKIGGVDAYRIRVSRRDGDQIDLLLDSRRFLEIRRRARHRVGSGVREVVTTFDDYRPVQGVMIPHLVTVRERSGGITSQTMTIDSVELNVSVKDSAFAMPPAQESLRKALDMPQAPTRPPQRE